MTDATKPGWDEDGMCNDHGKFACPKCATGEQFAESAKRSPTSEQRADTAALAERVWQALKERCCADPDNARRCVMVSRDDLASALRRTTEQPVADELLREAGERLADWQLEKPDPETLDLCQRIDAAMSAKGDEA